MGPGLATGSGVDVGQGQGLADGQGQGLDGVLPQSVLFARGQEISAMSWQDMVTRQAVEQVDHGKVLLLTDHTPGILYH